VKRRNSFSLWYSLPATTPGPFPLPRGFVLARPLDPLVGANSLSLSLRVDSFFGPLPLSSLFGLGPYVRAFRFVDPVRCFVLCYVSLRPARFLWDAPSFFPSPDVPVPGPPKVSDGSTLPSPHHFVFLPMFSPLFPRLVTPIVFFLCDDILITHLYVYPLFSALPSLTLLVLLILPSKKRCKIFLPTRKPLSRPTDAPYIPLLDVF